MCFGEVAIANWKVIDRKRWCMFTEPKISLRNEQPSIGIRAKTPFKGMFAVYEIADMMNTV